MPTQQQKEAYRLMKDRNQEYRKMKYDNLKITINLKTPVVCDNFVFFDGILSYFVAEDLFGENFQDMLGCMPFSFFIPLPLKKKKFDKTIFWSASVGFYEKGQCESIVFWKKGFDEEYSDYIDLKDKSGFINTSNSYFKLFRQPMIVHSAPSMTFYCCGNKDEIERILKNASNIGKKTSQGFGEIKSIEIEKIEKDYSLIKDNKIMRPIPAYLLSQIKVDNISSRFSNLRTMPPYWEKKERVLCALPE